MCGNNRFLLVSLLVAALLVMTSNSSQSFAQPGKPAPGQKAESQEPKSKDVAKTDQEGPVAITPRTSDADEKRVEQTPLVPNQLGTFGFPDINNKGEVAFLGRFISPSSYQGVGKAIMVRSGDTLRILVRDGDKASNLNEPLLDFSNPSINENSDLVFVGSFRDSTRKEEKPPAQPGAQPAPDEPKQSGIFIRNAAGLRMLAQIGQDVPRMPSRFGNLGSPTMNSKGLITFVGTYVDPDGRGLFFLDSTQEAPKPGSGGKSNLNLIVRSGQPSIAEGRMVYSEHFYPSAINERGEVAFFVRLGDSGGIFVKREKGIELVAQQGRPGPVEGSKYIGFGNMSPSINNKGDVAFVGFFDGEKAARALFIKEADKEGPPKMILKGGDPIGETGTTFTGFNSPAINDRGDVAFIGFYGGRTRGIFVKTEKGIQIIARAEDPVPGGGKDETFNNFASVTINDRGDVVFYGQIKRGAVGIFIKDANGLRQLIKRGDMIPDTKVANK